MVGKEYLKLRKTKCVLRFHVPSKLKKPEAYAHHLLFLYHPFRKEEELKGEFGTYGEKLTNPDVMECIRTCLLYTSPSPRDGLLSRMPSSA